MLKKLIKYEIYATRRYFLPFYGLMVALALLNRLFMSLQFQYIEIPQIILSIGMVTIMIGTGVLTLVMTIFRFYRNLLTSEGYLSFTLPVKAGTHIKAKLIVSILWFLSSVLVLLLSLLILLLEKEFLQLLPALLEQVRLIFAEQTFVKIILVLLALLFLLIATVSFIMKIYASIALGSQSGKHPIWVGIGSYLVYNTIEQLLLLGIILIASSLFLKGETWRWEFSFQGDAAMYSFAIWALICCLVFQGLLTAGYSAITHWLLTKKLNLK